MKIAGRVTNELFAAINRSLTDAAGNLPFGMGAVAIAGLMGSQILEEAVQSRFENVMKIANIERPMAGSKAMGGFSGGFGEGYFGHASNLGFRTSEAAQMMSQFSRSIGAKGGGKTAFNAGVDPFQATLSGMSSEMMARYVSLGGLGGGATGGIGGVSANLSGAMGTLQGKNFDLRGAKVDEALARISSATTQMAEQGLSLNLGSVNQSMADLAASGAAAAGGGPNAFGGMHAVRGTMKLSQTAGQAGGMFTAPFANLQQIAIQGYIAKKSSTLRGAVQMKEHLQRNPHLIPKIIRDQLGNADAAYAAGVGGGFSSDQADVLSNAGVTGIVTTEGAMGTGGPGDTPLSGALAKNEYRSMQAAFQLNAASNIKMIDSMGRIEAAMVKLSRLADPVIDGAHAIIKFTGM